MTRFLRTLAFVAVLAGLCNAGEVAARAPVELVRPVQDKNFYFLSMIERTPEARRAVEADPILRKLASAHHEALAHALESCAEQLSCYTRALTLSDTDIEEATTELRRLRLAMAPLLRSGMFQRYSSMGDQDLVTHAWTDAAPAINGIIEVYGNGAKPRYPEIDSISYDVSTPRFRDIVRAILAVNRRRPCERCPLLPALALFCPASAGCELAR